MSNIIDEFTLESIDILEETVSCFLDIEQGKDALEQYKEIFRGFHSIKGSAGMMGLDALKNHMHLLEDRLHAYQDNPNELKGKVDFFLSGIDAAKEILKGNQVNFEFGSPDEEEEISPIDSIHKSTKSTVKPAGEDALKIFFFYKHNEDFVTLEESLKTAQTRSTAYQNRTDKILEEVKTDLPHIIITDLNPSAGNNFEILRKLHMTFPIILIVKDCTEDLVEKANELGINFYAKELINSNALLKICTSEIKKKKLADITSKSMRLLMYLYSDIEDYLKDKPDDTIKSTIKTEMFQVLNDYSEVKG